MFLHYIYNIDEQEHIASLESLNPAEIRLYAEGIPISDESLVSAFEAKDLELTVALLGGKVHGSLARAGNS